jgi:hypothetical protein
MKSLKSFFSLLIVAILISIGGCKKSSSDSSGCYTPTNADTTATATLAELQQGRSLYISNCNKCHSLYSPDNYAPSQWKSILSSMGPKTSMSASEIELVTKYVCKGQQ